MAADPRELSPLDTQVCLLCRFWLVEDAERIEAGGLCTRFPCRWVRTDPDDTCPFFQPEPDPS